MHRARLLRSILLLSLFGAIPAIGRAEWPADGLPLPDPSASIAADDRGGMYYSYRQDDGVWLGRLGPDGTQIHGFPIQVGTRPGWVQLQPDGAGGAYVAWVIVDSVHLRKLVARRIRPDGTTAFTAVRDLDDASDSWYDPRVVTASGQGVLFAGWFEFRAESDDDQLTIIRIDSTGFIRSGWPLDVPGTVPAGNAYPQIRSDGQSGVLVTIHADTMRTTRFDRDGQQIWTRSVPIEWFDHYEPHAMPDGAGGIYIAHSPPVGRQGFVVRPVVLQHVTIDGVTWPGWPDSGIVINNPAWPEPVLRDAALATDEHGGVFVTYEVDDGDGHPNIACQRINADGTIASGWPDYGVFVIDAGNHQKEVAAIPDGSGGVLVAWQDWRDRIHGAIAPYAQRLDANGQRHAGWPETGVRLSGTVNADEPFLVTDGTGGAFVGWTGFDQLHDPTWIQRVRGDGVFGPLLSEPASKLRIAPSFPNPSSGVVYCDVQIATGGDVIADVHDIRGRRIASLVTDASGGAGAHRFRWDGYDQHGTLVSPGIYFLVVRTPTETATARIAIVR